MQTAIKAQPVSDAQSPMDLVLIHGWGSNENIWAPLITALSSAFQIHTLELPGHGNNAETWPSRTERLLEAWSQSLPPQAAYMGWSLGGSLALCFAQRYPERVSALITLASTPCFVARPDWTLGMSEREFTEFQARLALDTSSCLQYFSGLQAMGDTQLKEVRRTLTQCAESAPADASGLASGLETLAQLDLRDSLEELNTPHLALFGAEDKLVPAGVAHALPARSSHWTLAGCGHAPHLSRPKAVAARVTDFLIQQNKGCSRSRNKQQVAASFGRADEYDRAAELQQATGHTLLNSLPEHQTDRLLDLGCGTGFFTQALAERADTVLGVDISKGMLQRAQQTGAVAHWLCGDAEALPIADSSIDQIFSSLAIQWCENLAQLSTELARVLRPGGEAALATLGPDTLWELRAAWRAVDSKVHVNRFASPSQLCTAFAEAGLQVICATHELQTRRASTVIALARELRAIGAHNLNPGRQTGLTGKARWQQLDAAYRTLCDGKSDLPVTWAIDIYRLRKPH